MKATEPCDARRAAEPVQFYITINHGDRVIAAVRSLMEDQMRFPRQLSLRAFAILCVVLGESQELNVVYQKIAENLPAIEQEIAANRRDLQLTKKGGGALADSVRATATLPKIQATLANDIAREREKAKKRGTYGIDGLNADTAEMIARREVVGEWSQYNAADFVLARFGTTAGEQAARAATTLGADPRDAGLMGAEVTRAAYNPLFYAQNKLGGDYITEKFLGLFRQSSEKMDRAASKLEQSSANLGNKPVAQPSQIDAGRDQASRANQ